MKHKGKVETFLARLCSVYRDDLNVDDVDPRYVWQYRNNLIGCPFRFICQRAPLQMYNLLDHADRPLYQLMLAIGRLAAHLWYPVIRDMPKYLEELQIYVDNVQDYLDESHLDMTLKKPKVHCFSTPYRMFDVSALYQATERQENTMLSSELVPYMVTVVVVEYV